MPKYTRQVLFEDYMIAVVIGRLGGNLQPSLLSLLGTFVLIRFLIETTLILEVYFPVKFVFFVVPPRFEMY